MLGGTGLRTVLVRVVFSTVLMMVMMVAAVKVELTPLSDQVYTTGPRRMFKTLQLRTQLALENRNADVELRLSSGGAVVIFGVVVVAIFGVDVVAIVSNTVIVVVGGRTVTVL